MICMKSCIGIRLKPAMEQFDAEEVDAIVQLWMYWSR